MPLRTALADTRLIASLLTIAETEARTLGEPEPGAEHLLLAALLVEDPSAQEALNRANAAKSGSPTAVDAPAVRAAIGAVHAASLASIGVIAPDASEPLPPAAGLYRSEVSAQEVFQRARVLAKRSPLGLLSAHVLLAAAERERGTVARVLENLGINRVALLDAATARVA